MEVNNMLKNIFAGIFIGIANIIPGISGGTIIVILGIFDELMFSISNLIKKDNPQRKKQIIFLSQIIFGLLIGLISFANIIDYLFKNYPTQTIYGFIGLILFSIPFVIKKELPNTTWFKIPFTKRKNNLSVPFLIIGSLIIIILMLLNKNVNDNLNIVFPTITILYLIKLFFVGNIIGSATIIPGISGAMILLILGQYHIYKGYILELLTFKLNILIPLCFIGIGIIMGIVIGAKIVTWSLNKYRKETISLIIGLIIMSSLALFPLDINYNVSITVSSIICFLLGGTLITIIERLNKTK
jgi:putative membrane protein